MEIIGIVLGVIAIGLIFALRYWFKKEQQIAINLLKDDVKGIEKGYMAFQTEFTSYQVKTDRKIIDLEKQLEIKSNNAERRMDKMNKSLPSVIGQVVGQIEFAQDTINRQM